jgi:hypothetical protein
VRLLSSRTVAYVTRNYTGRSGRHLHGHAHAPARLVPTSRGLTDTIRRLGSIASPRTFGHVAWAAPTAGPIPTAAYPSRTLTNGRIPDPWHGARTDVISNCVHAAINVDG